MGTTQWPAVQYAPVGDDQVAFAVFGDGPIDLVFCSGMGSHVDLAADDPAAVRLLRGLSEFSRVIYFNRRGTGLSDGIARNGLPTWEDWTDDLRAVLDAAGSSRASVLALSDAGPIALQFAATHPDRVEALILVNTTARYSEDHDYPIGMSPEAVDEVVGLIAHWWGTVEFVAGTSGDGAESDEVNRLVARQLRACATPSTAAAQFRYILDTMDARSALPLVDAPTLVLHNRANRLVPPAHGRVLAHGLSNARLVELAGSGVSLDDGGVDAILDEVSEFVTGRPRARRPHDRVLATIMFSDIVGSTVKLAEMGDERWRQVLDRHDEMARREIAAFGGREIATTGDGFFVAFDGPGKAIRCGTSMRDQAAAMGVPIRIGIHVGECEVRGADLAGIAVHVAARVAAVAGGSDVLVTSLAAQLTKGSELRFEPLGTHELRGVDGQWELLSVLD